jgi:tRNA A-37 threonylcarbamoyl transferase component Bud32
MEPEQPANHCPECQASLGPDAPEGLCPTCLLKQVAAPTEHEPNTASPAPAPQLSRLQEAFPELEIHEMVGQGGMGAVFKVSQRRMHRTVALKVLPESLAQNPEFSERFTREAQVLARLTHPNIVTLYDFGERKGIYFLLMEFVDGVNLRQAMEAARFSPEQALKVVPRICDALDYAHQQGVLHRDIKPANILLDTDGTIKLADFGIAKLTDSTESEITLTRTGGTLGTPHYMAPEQIEKPSEVDHRADIYSLGVVLYEMLTGELPIGRFAAPSIKSEAHPGIDSVVLRALEKDRNERQQSAGEMKTDVETANDPSPSVDQLPELPKTLPSWSFWLIGLLLIGLVLTVGFNILKLVAGYFEVLQVLSFATDHRVFLRIAFEAFSVFAVASIAWSHRQDLVASLPLRHPKLDLSLYPLVLISLIIGLFPTARNLAFSIGTFGFHTFQFTLVILLTIAATRRSEPRSDGYNRSASSCSLGTVFLWLALIVPVIYFLLFSDTPQSVENDQKLDILRQGSLSLGWFGTFTSIVPIGIALATQSRKWRVIAIYFSVWSLVNVFLSLYAIIHVAVVLRPQNVINQMLSLSFWLGTIISAALPFLALPALLKRNRLAHFGLEPRTAGFFPSPSKLFTISAKNLMQTGIVITGVGIIGSGGLNYLFESGGEAIAKNRVESYNLKFLREEIKKLKNPALNEEQDLITILGVSNDRLGDQWWDTTGLLIPKPKSIHSPDIPLIPEPLSETHHLLIRVTDTIPSPYNIKVTLNQGTKGRHVVQPLVQVLSNQHRLLTFYMPRSTDTIGGTFEVSPEKATAVAQARTRREQQLSTTLRFRWTEDFDAARQVLEWMSSSEGWSFEMWGHSITRSISSHSRTIHGDSDIITAEFPMEIGSFSSFLLFVKPKYRQEINQIPLSPKSN